MQDGIKKVLVLILYWVIKEKRAIKVKGSTHWKKLPADLKETKSLPNFKNKLKSHLLYIY